MSFINDVTSAVGKGFEKVSKSAGREVERALDEHVTHIEEDFDSIAKAIDEGGLLGGVVQSADVFSPGHVVANELDAWNVIPEDPALKELVSAGTNLATGGPFALLAAKDLADSIGAISKANGPRPAPSTSHAAPPPPREPARHAEIPHGYATSCVERSPNVIATQQASLKELGEVLAALRGMRDARADYVKQNPGALVPSDGHYTIDEILNHPSMSTGEVCCRVVAVILHEHPEALDEIGGSTGTTPPSTPAPKTPSAEATAPANDTQAGQAVFGIFGQIASFVGPLLGNPLVATALSALLLATPLAPIAPFLPVILPLAGSALGMLGGAATQVAQGQDPTLTPGAMAGGQGGASPDLLGGLLQAIPSMLGAAPAAAPAPALAA
jgi:hypothetical protein